MRQEVTSGGALTPAQQMVASGSGVLLTSLFVTPLDVVKVRLQSQQTPSYQALALEAAPPRDSIIRHSERRGFLFCKRLLDNILLHQNRSSCSAQFSGTLDAFVKIVRYEGLRSLWSGLSPTLVMAVPATIMYFTCYDALRDFLWCNLGPGNYAPFLAGAAARMGAVTVISPLELVRTKMQSRRRPYRELLACIRWAVAQHGVLSLWRGWGPTVLRDVPFSAFYWSSYEALKAGFCHHTGASHTNFLISFGAGGLSGAVAAILTLPFDVVKTQRQIVLGEVDPLLAPVKKTSSTWKILREIWAELGYRGLFAGLWPRVLRVAPSCAITISTYEFGKAFFQRTNGGRQ